jgi:hypothetical protein
MPILQVGVAQVGLLGTGQLPTLRHWVQWPAPSHTVPPELLQVAPAGESPTPQQPLVQAACTQSPSGAGQSVGTVHAAVHIPPPPVPEVLDVVEPPPAPYWIVPRTFVHEIDTIVNSSRAVPA